MNIVNIIKIVLSILIFTCLADMSYGFYQFVRFVAMVSVAYLAYLANEQNYKNELFGYIALAILFQPFAKIPLGRTIWNIIDVVVGIGLLVSIITPKNKKELQMKKAYLFIL
jgi:membrane associated rhomboid family serine protease